jgi:hypothetical protein
MAIQFDPFSFGVATFALAVAVMQLYWNRPQRQEAVSWLLCLSSRTISDDLNCSPWLVAPDLYIRLSTQATGASLIVSENGAGSLRVGVVGKREWRRAGNTLAI